MYNSKIFCVIFTLMLGILVFHTAEAEESLSVSTSNAIYYDGDYVVIFGSVKTVFEGMPITIQIYQDTNLITIAQPNVAKDGTFVASFYATGTKWNVDGTYTVRAQYTPTQIGEVTFQFFNQVIDESSEIFPVNIPNSGSFDVGYTVRGGEVKDIVMNQEHYSLLIETAMDTNGNMILKLPRDSFDAQNDDVDTTFIILISKQNNIAADFMQVEYEEIAVGPDYRTIRIPLEEGDKWVEVIGTYVIPEFGSVAIIILVVAVSSAIIMSKSKFSVRYN
jgi:predicted secreted protein with PEFG-CTERM motif